METPLESFFEGCDQLFTQPSIVNTYFQFIFIALSCRVYVRERNLFFQQPSLAFLIKISVVLHNRVTIGLTGLRIQDQHHLLELDRVKMCLETVTKYYWCMLV